MIKRFLEVEEIYDLASDEQTKFYFADEQEEEEEEEEKDRKGGKVEA
ncbi:hypothetical protein [Flavobacterium hydrophilum]|nr:hypothetical protein [Flavobacterium hydrophilum]